MMAVWVFLDSTGPGWSSVHQRAPLPCCDSYHFVFLSRRVRAVAVGPSTEKLKGAG